METALPTKHFPFLTASYAQRSFVVVVLKVGGKSCAKNVPNGTKIAQGNKKFS